jgi:PKD repeat protein
VNYGDGSPDESLTLAGNTFTFSHVYTTAGNYTVNVSITDDDGGSGSASAAILVNAPVSVSSPQEKTRMVIDKIKTLISTGAISSGNGNALTSKLDSAIQAFDKGNANAAANTLNSFINQVNALVKSGKLSPSEGQALISAAQAIIDGK